MSSETLLSRFIDAWVDGERPDVDAFLEQAPEAEREQLAAEIRTFLEHAPSPRHSDAAREQIRAQPLTRRIAEMPEELGLWPALLPSLRKRARLRRDQVVAELAKALDVTGATGKVARYYHGMEAGTLDPGLVSQRVLDALATVLGASARELAQAGEFEGFGRAAPQGAFGRLASMAAPEVDVVAARAPASPGTTAWDEVDELFQGGR